MASAYTVPGVYYEPRPRAIPRALPRTDVAGFIGFEPRITDGTTASQLLGSPPAGHAFRVNVRTFLLPVALTNGVRITVQGAVDFVLSQSDTSIPIVPGGSIRYAIGAITKSGALFAISGIASVTSYAGAPTDEQLTAAAGTANCVRIADVLVRRSADGASVFPAIVPALPPTRCDDWRDFTLQMGGIPAVDDGTLLAQSVRAYFANGASRCYVMPVRRPRFDDEAGLADAIEDLVGIEGASEREATGLERLLQVFEVAVVDAPDLYARRVDPDVRTVPIPPVDKAACFRCCNDLTPPGTITAVGANPAMGPVFADDAVLAAQRAMLLRCAPERWRVLLLLTSPVALDPATGLFAGPNAKRALAWRKQLTGAVDDLTISVGAFYHPWAWAQDKIGAPLVELPPTALAAGVIARRDLARGPHIAPANERLIGVVGLSPTVDVATNAELYAPPMNINVLRAMAGEGIQIWGARTLSGDMWMRYLPVRRCLSAIERKAFVALNALVFEPNTVTLWFQITQAMLGILTPIFNAGALRGSTAEQSFYVRCDNSNNPPETIAQGQVLCEVGVAIAAPAEFIVFRVGRDEGVVEVIE
jgi:hypothetical protein